MNETGAATLADILVEHGLSVPAANIDLLDRYCHLLWEWNEKINLTRHTDYQKFVSRDVLDSSQLAALLAAGESVLDVGSGGGVPGLVIAILRPDVRVTLCESMEKKAKVLADMVAKLKLPVAVIHGRGEQALGQQRFDAVMARAVGSLAKILRWFEPHWPRMGRMLLIKGPKWADERGESRHLGLLKQLELRKAAEYPMPGTDSQSVILKIWPKGQGSPDGD